MNTKRRRRYAIESDESESSESETIEKSLDKESNNKKSKIEKPIEPLNKHEQQARPIEANEIDNYLRVVHELLKGEETDYQSSCDGQLTDLSFLPGIYIDQIGFVSLPLIDVQKNTLKEFCTQVSDGIYELEWSKYECKNSKWVQDVNKFGCKVAKELLGFAGECELVQKKLLLSETGGCVGRHKFSNDTNEFGYLIIQLPSLYTGGNLNIFNDNSKITYDFGQVNNSSLFGFNYVAFDSTVEFEFDEIKSGCRLLMLYSFKSTSNQASQIFNFINRKNPNVVLSNAMHHLVQPDLLIAIELEENYTADSFRKKGLKKLNEWDREMYLKLKEANDALDEDKRYTFAIALASVKSKLFEYDPKALPKEHTCDCNRCGYNQGDDDDDNDDQEEMSDNFFDEEAEEDSEEEEDDDDDDENESNTDEDDEDKLEIDENSHPLSKSKFIRPIKIWYDANGIELFENEKSDLRLFTRIIRLSNTNQEPFVDNLDEESAWKREYHSFANAYTKYMLVMWPKKYENRIYIRLDLSTYIKSTFKSLVCDAQANIEIACENLEIIVKELIKKQDDSSLEYEHFYQIFESLKFTQNDHLSIEFLASKIFKHAYTNLKIDILNELALLVKDIGVNKLRHTLMDLLMYNHKESERNAKFIVELYNADEREFAFELFKSFILPEINLMQVDRIVDFDLKHLLNRNSNRENVIIALLLLKNDKDFKNKSLHIDYLKSFLEAGLSTIESNLDKFLLMLEKQEYGYAVKCLHENVLVFLRDESRMTRLVKHEKCIKSLVCIFEKIITTAAAYTYALEMIVEKLKAHAKYDTESIDNVIQELRARDTISKHPLVTKIISNQMQFYEREIGKIVNIGWKMPEASFVRHPKVEEFLKSSKRSLEYKDLADSKHARNFANKYRGFQSGYSINMKVVGNGKRVLITKTKEFADSLQGTKIFYENKAGELRKLLI